MQTTCEMCVNNIGDNPLKRIPKNIFLLVGHYLRALITAKMNVMLKVSLNVFGIVCLFTCLWTQVRASRVADAGRCSALARRWRGGASQSVRKRRKADAENIKG